MSNNLHNLEMFPSRKAALSSLGININNLADQEDYGPWAMGASAGGSRPALLTPSLP